MDKKDMLTITSAVITPDAAAGGYRKVDGPARS